MPGVRVDVLLVEKGLVESRSQAQRLVMAGQVRVDGQVVYKSSTTVPSDAELTLELGSRYVSRGGYKLETALETFRVDVNGWVCADLGSSTGGFSDCLLQHGARKVYAIDVGRGLLHWKLRQDSRIHLMEGVNARFLDRLPDPIKLVTIDAAFISLKLLLPVVNGWMTEKGEVICLIKPQFEAGRKSVSRGKGVIRDPQIHEDILHQVLLFATENRYAVRGLIRSPLLGPKGNVEFLAWLGYPGTGDLDIESLIQRAVHENHMDPSET